MLGLTFEVKMVNNCSLLVWVNTQIEYENISQMLRVGQDCIQYF